ncbi:MAG: DUF1598 domain-containing protein, partial [Planctomycetes bacterium]|nr:DUF1598 domain-containing protein [Planctomycetota bacterium]
MRRVDFRRIARWSIFVAAFTTVFLALPKHICAQAQVGTGGVRPFITGWIPVIGRNGAIGGVQVSADGVVQRADVDATGKLRKARMDALKELPRDIARVSKLRKISLRRLETAIARHLRQKTHFTEEIHNLAGLQQIQYVFLYPDDQDIVLAGPAEGWKVDQQGYLVGLTSERPVLQLADLIVALRSAEDALDSGITCSIDPTKEGLARVSQLLSRRLQPGPSAVASLKKAVGPQIVTIKGIDADCHFARVMLAADVMMKRLAMNLEPAPTQNMPSYMHLLRTASGSPRNMIPRWWVAPNYEPLLRSEDKLAWRIPGPGVKIMTEQETLARNGETTRTGKAHPAAKKWAETFTAKYDELAGGIKETLRPYLRDEPKVDVRIVKYGSRYFYVQGAV